MIDDGHGCNVEEEAEDRWRYSASVQYEKRTGVGCTVNAGPRAAEDVGHDRSTRRDGYHSGVCA